MKPLSKSQQRKTRDIGESIDTAALTWAIWQWQKEMVRSKIELQDIERKLAKALRATISQTRSLSTLRRQRDTRNRRRKLLILWISTAQARIDALEGDKA